jgi:predicted  nucleic acid-binding Zn-ribbon protein
MSEEPLQSNNLITEQINESESSTIINVNKKREDLIKHLKDVHCKSEEKTFDLNEKFNQIKEDLQKLIDEYKMDCDKSDLENNDIDFSSIKDYINDYIANERINSINNINNAFEKVNNSVEEIIENNNSNINKIENILLEIKNEFDQNYNDIVNHSMEINTQKEDINNKLNVQMKEQFAKLYDLIGGEEQSLNNSQIEKINGIQNFIKNLVKNMKNEKIK